jgi:hypothetical protein
MDIILLLEMECKFYGKISSMDILVVGNLAHLVFHCSFCF